MAQQDGERPSRGSPDSSVASILAAARRRGALIRAELVTNKIIITGDELITTLQITDRALNEAVKAGRVFVVEHGGRDYYPAFFADPALERKQVERVCQALGDSSGWEKWLFFNQPKASLGGRTPVEALRQGAYDLVQRAAAAQAER